MTRSGESLAPGYDTWGLEGEEMGNRLGWLGIAVLLASCGEPTTGPTRALLRSAAPPEAPILRASAAPEGGRLNVESGDITSAAELVDSGRASLGITLGSSSASEQPTLSLTVRPLREGPRSPPDVLARHRPRRAQPTRSHLAAELGAATGAVTVDVIVSFTLTETDTRPFQERLLDQLDSNGHSRAEELHFDSDLVREARQAISRERIDARLAQIDPLVGALEALGATELERFGVAGASAMTVPAASLQAIASLPFVDMVEPIATDSGQLDIDGLQAMWSTQTEQYVVPGHTGTGVRVAVVDFAFEDDFESIGDTRIAQTISGFGERYECDTTGCSWVPDLSVDLSAPPTFLNPSGNHGTTVAQFAAGNTGAGQYDKGGPARTAELILIQAAKNHTSVLRAFEHVAYTTADILSSSVAPSETPRDIYCEGTDASSRAIDELARSHGILAIHSAGNNGSSAATCNIVPPAGAAWSVAVGATMGMNSVQASTADYLTAQSAPIASYSSRGGHPYLGGYRAIVDVTAVGAQVYQPYGMPDTYALTGEGTSFAQPLIAGAAADMRDWWRQNYSGFPGWYSSQLEEPGFYIVQLLLMGDRASASLPYPLPYQLDQSFGAGRFRARVWENPSYGGNVGMDPPWKMEYERFAIGNAGTVSFDVNDGVALPSEVDRLYVAMFWPEEDQVNGADIVLHVRRTCGPSGADRSDWSYDTRKRVSMTDTTDTVGDRCWRIDVESFSVPPSVWYGGYQVREVYLAYYYEDSSRDQLLPHIQ